MKDQKHVSFDPFQEQNLFYKYKLQVSQEEIDQILLIINNQRFKNNNQLSTYYTLNILNFPILKNLKNQIITILDNYNLYLENNWVQLYNKEDSHGVHTHTKSHISGILYLCDKGTSTTFYDREFNTYENNVEKNTLILFPSWIPHEVKKLTTNEKRLVISFNTFKK